MKKLFSILLFSFFSMLTFQASAMTAVEKPATEIQQKKTVTIKIAKQDVFEWWCLTIVTNVTVLGEDMAGNIWV